MKRVLLIAACLLPLACSLYGFAAPPADANVSTVSRDGKSSIIKLPRLLSDAELSVDSRLKPYVLPGQKFVVNVQINEKGEPTEIKVLDSPFNELNAMVVDSVRNYRWKPAKQGNREIAFNTELVLEVR